MKAYKVYIDPRTNIEYASFYIFGLYKVFGRGQVKFSRTPFQQLHGFEHFLAITIHQSQQIKKIIIDYTDSKQINQLALDWCDVYGKINITRTDLNVSNKLLAIGPSFGIKLFNLSQTLYYGVSNYIKSAKDLKFKKQFLSSYKAQYKRPLMSSYKPEKSDSNFIFFMASLWKNEPKTNAYRANFIKSCLALTQLNFEGGFVPRKKNDIKGFEHITTDKRLPTHKYFTNLKRSSVVFNTPAVKDCHGWKLAEYLALGKAIISTPLSRVLPAELIDNETIIISDGSFDDINAKLQYFDKSSDLKVKLEINAIAYYNNNLQPSVVINRLINFIESKKL